MNNGPTRHLRKAAPDGAFWQRATGYRRPWVSTGYTASSAAALPTSRLTLSRMGSENSRDSSTVWAGC
jgi:hypothetical protein